MKQINPIQTMLYLLIFIGIMILPACHKSSTEPEPKPQVEDKSELLVNSLRKVNTNQASMYRREKQLLSGRGITVLFSNDTTEHLWSLLKRGISASTALLPMNIRIKQA